MSEERVPKRKQYRNLKPELAPPDDEIYQLGFVVGGRRLVGTKQDVGAKPDPEKEKQKK